MAPFFVLALVLFAVVGPDDDPSTDDLERLGYRRAFGRAFVTLAFLVTYVWILDVLWPLWDERKQALHDKVADSVVVRAGG